LLGRRDGDGTYGAAVRLSDVAVTSSSSITSTSFLIARAGVWRAIWAEDIAPQSAAAVLFEAGSGFQRRQVTQAVEGRETFPTADVRMTDNSVRLAYQVENPPGHWTLVLSAAPSMTGKFSTPRNLVGDATTPLDPQVATDGDYTYVAFLDEKVPTLGELPTPDAAMSKHGFYSLTGGSYVRVAVSSGVPVIAWSAPRGAEGDGSDVDIAEKRAGRWYQQRAAAPPDYVYALLLHLSSTGGRATVIYLQDSLTERTE
jgi:hypothetical protein